MTGGLVTTATGRAENYFAMLGAVSAARLTNNAIFCRHGSLRTTLRLFLSTVLAYLVDNVTTEQTH
jgi:hypothetical protein